MVLRTPIRNFIHRTPDYRHRKTPNRRFENLEERRLLTEVGGVISSDTLWSREESPYTVVDDIDVAENATLKIEAGVVVEFARGTGLDVKGRIVAEGSPWERISFQPVSSRWDGISFEDTLADNRFAYVDFVAGDAQGEALDVDDSRLLLDNVTWTGTRGTILELNHPSLIVRDSHFPVSTSGDEIIHGSQIEDDEYLIIQGNVFANSNNGGDVIDFLGAERPGPVLQILDNVFLGGGDDGLDLDGTDAHIEGNLFMNFQKNTGRNTTSNAIATGLPQDNDPNRTEVTIVRNIFIDNDHALLLKEDAFATVENNVFVGTKLAVIQFGERNGTAVRGPGKGADLDGNIFFENSALFENLVDEDDFTTQLTVARSLLPNESLDFDGTSIMAHDLGTGNIEGDPLFVDAANHNFRLQPDSPARTSGPFGLDMGAYVDAGPQIMDLENGNLQIGGPGITHYRYRIGDEPLSGLLSVSEVIELTGRPSDEQRIEVVGMNSAGEWFHGQTPAFRERSAQIITPTAMRSGERLPVVVRAKDHRGIIDSTFSTTTQIGDGQASNAELRIKKGVGTALLPINASSDFTLTINDDWAGTPALSSAPNNQQISLIDSASPVVEYSGELTGDTVFEAGIEHRLLGDVTIPEGSHLQIAPGARVLVGEKVNLHVNGQLTSSGSATEPVYFSSITEAAWGGVRIENAHADFRYTFFTNGGGDETKEFGHSDSQPVLFADSATLDCDNCFVMYNVGKGVGARDNSEVNLHQTIISNSDTGGEFVRSVAHITESYVKDIPNDDNQFVDDDNDGFYFSGVARSGQASIFQDSFVFDTKDDGLDHNGARLQVVGSWVEGADHEGIASSNRESVYVTDSVFLHNNQGLEAGYGRPQLDVENSVVIRNDSSNDPDSPVTAGIRFGDGYDGSNGAYEGHIRAVDLVLADNGDNVRNFDGSLPGPKEGAIDITSSVTNDTDVDQEAGNETGIPILGRSMHLLRGSAGFSTGTDNMPMGRRFAIVSRSIDTGNTVGDFNDDTLVDGDDIFLLCEALRNGTDDSAFDLNLDGTVSDADRDVLILDVLGSTYGDANLDGVFDSSDFVFVFQQGEYEDDLVGNSSWNAGDWNCDGEFTTQDLVVAFQFGGYIQNSRPLD